MDKLGSPTGNGLQATQPKRQPGRLFITLFFLGAIGALILVVIINLLVDPFQFFRAHAYPGFSNNLLRQQQPGIIRNYPYNSVMVGNSVGANFRPQMFAAYDKNLKFQNLILYGSTVEEAALSLNLAYQSHRLDTVFWAIGRQQSRGFRINDFPLCMYQSAWSVFPYCYLMNIDVFRESIAQLAQFIQAGSRHPIPQLAGLSQGLSHTAWQAELPEWKSYGHLTMEAKEFACRYHQSLIRLPGLLHQWKSSRPPDTTADGSIREAFRELVYPIVDRHPETKFVFFYAPVFAAAIALDIIGGPSQDINEQLAIQSDLMMRPNVEIHDFRHASKLTRNINHYRDESHYDTETVEHIVVALKEQRYRIHSIQQNLAALDREILYGADVGLREFRDKCP